MFYVYVDVMDVDVSASGRWIWLYVPMLSQVFSISLLCFKYMGQTWPSNRPGGSGIVYVLVLQKHNQKTHYNPQ